MKFYLTCLLENMSKNILLDTNILLDLFLERPYMLTSTKEIFDGIESGDYYGYIADISLINISYIAWKYRPQEVISEYLLYLCQVCNILYPTLQDITTILQNPYIDFEDSIQASCAKQVDANIITRDSQWFTSIPWIRVFSPDQFLNVKSFDV